MIDLSPLSGLASLQSLILLGTRLIDLSPLTGLSSLQTLHLSATQVRDLTPESWKIYEAIRKRSG